MSRKPPKIFDGWDGLEPEDEKSSGSGGARKESSEHGKLSWWEEFESDRFGDTGSTKSDFKSYSYRDAFDDSDKSWYKQSSFRYSGYSDYSPSSLFRSSFSSWGYVYTAGNDVKNKAIRALRTLRRNANTVADAAAKISYDVQFSNGADSNGVSADMSAKKQQVIFVSPDAICEAKTADAEDEAVDALTGFVLLRVQIAQSVKADCIRDINAMSLRGSAATIAQIIRESDGKFDAKTVAAKTVDGYSASILAKSMLMRLSRRAVVEDWGGFAPYFVRHAKQFAAVKERLLKTTELSAENLAAQVAYNMAAAEDEIPLDKEVSDIVAKHLGAQLPAEKILVACVKLMEDLRAYVESKNPTPPADTLEAALAEGLQGIFDEQEAKMAAHKEEAEVMRGQMKNVAELFDKMIEEAAAGEEAAEKAAQKPKPYDLDAAEGKFNDIRYKGRVLDTLNDLAEELQKQAVKPNTPGTAGVVRNLQQTVENNRQHFKSQLQKLVDGGAPPLPARETYAGMLAPAAAEKQANDLKEFVKAARAVLKQEVNEMLGMLKDGAAQAAAHAEAAAKQISDTKAAVEAVRDQLHSVYPKCLSAADPIKHTNNMLDSLRGQERCLGVAMKELKNAADTLSSGRKSLKSIADAGSTVTKWLNHPIPGHAPLVLETSWGGSGAEQRFAASAVGHHENIKDGTTSGSKDAWHAPAIEQFLEDARNAPGEANFGNQAIKEANRGLFEALKKLFYDKESGSEEIPATMRGVADDKKAKIEAAAESMGMTAQELLKVLRAVVDDENRSKENLDASLLGELIKEKLMPMAKQNSPIDDGLFGEMVEKVTALLDDSSVNQVNDEARNLAEEDYVAYLSHTDAKPAIKVKKMTKKEAAGGGVIVKRVIAQNRAAVSRIREALQFQSTKRVGEVYGLRSGDLDEGSLHKLRYDSEHIWSQKTVSQLPDVAVGILVDQSGSMNSGYKIEQARDMCIILSEAVRKVSGVHLHIYGHTANQNDRADLTLFEHHSSILGAENADLSGLGNIRAYSNNYDGYAIKETARLLSQDPAKRKYLFVISDGLPHGNGYAGDEAEKHVASVCSFVRTRLKIPTYAFAVGVPDYDRGSFEEQYGKTNVLFLSRVNQCLPQITRFLRNALQKEKTLVDVSSD
jgi:hypothetical protein